MKNLNGLSKHNNSVNIFERKNLNELETEKKNQWIIYHSKTD